MLDPYEYNYILSKYLYPELMHGLDSDKTPANILGSQLEERGTLYTTLLKNYTKTTHARNIFKEIHKWLFFWGIIGVGIIVTSLGYQIIKKVLSFEDDRLFIESVPVLITAFVAFLSVVIGVPLTITNFLFNVAEDNNITSTIHDTQLHDFKEIRLLKDRYTEKAKPKQKNPSRQKQTVFDDDFEAELFDEEDFASFS